ncbi:patatin [Mycobacterium sp. shizuoka-1]|nr:patatin [Mycobacterium sp. shizuoka-1]
MTDPQPDNPADVLSPVRRIPGDENRQPERGLALCLSGGGYRAMIFHLGVLWRLNELGLLPDIKRFSSVSGGSITAGVLAMNWEKLGFDGGKVASNFVDAVVAPLRRMAGTRIDIPALVTGVLLPGASVADRVADAYRRNLFGHTTLQDLPDDPHGPPRFIFNSTSLETGVLLRFSKPYLADYKVGRILNPGLDLAVAVAASSAFPPILSPCTLDLKGQRWIREPGNDEALDRPEYRDEITVTDGGVYDNLGLETAWKNFTDIVVSDGGGQLAEESDPRSDWVRQTYRVLTIIDSQVRALRKRQIIGSIIATVRKGMYVGIRSRIPQEFPQAVLPARPEKTRPLAEISTRLDALSGPEQEGLINWGYVVCDAGLRSHYLRAQLRGEPATPLPYPELPLG